MQHPGPVRPAQDGEALDGTWCGQHAGNGALSHGVIFWPKRLVVGTEHVEFQCPAPRDQRTAAAELGGGVWRGPPEWMTALEVATS